MQSGREFSTPRRARLNPPRLPADMVVRPRLINRLNRMASLVLVVAPAGYGKTTLVSTWLSQLDMSHAWLSLDAEDNNLQFFLAAVAAAVARIYPDFGSGILALLNSSNSVPFADLTVLLINELNAVDGEFVLVLDDYHLIHEPAIHDLLRELVSFPPHGMCLVLTSRYDPPLPWNIRARGDFCELRADDLRFTEDEAAQFLAKASNRPVSSADLLTLLEQSQGWITSLRLATLAIRRQEQGIEWSDVTTASLRNFDDYFNNELLTELDPSTLAFLLRTSILDLLNSSLCDSVAGPAQGDSVQGSVLSAEPLPLGGSGALLRELERVGAFTMVLDDDATWYRYHPLLRSALRRKLDSSASAAEVSALYARASIWYEEHGLLDEALAYALTSRQTGFAVALLQRRRPQLMNRLEWRRLAQWLEQFPAEAVAEHVELTLTRAWISFWRYNLPEAAVDVERLPHLLSRLAPDDPYSRSSYGEMMALRAQQCIFVGDSEGAVAAAQAALAAIPEDRFLVRSTSLIYLVFSCHMSGQWEQVLAYNAAFAAEESVPRDLARARFLQACAHVNLLATNLADLRSACPQWLDLIAARNYKTNEGWIHCLWASACYLQGDLQGAAEHFGAVLELVDHAPAQAYVQSAIGLALTYQALGLAQEAFAVVDGARRSLEARHQYFMLTVANAFAAELAARQGRIEEARRWIVRQRSQHVTDAFPSLYAPGLAFVRILLLDNSEENLRNAQEKLNGQMELAVRTHNKLVQIQSHALQAALDEAAGDRTTALVALKQALDLAEHGQVSRVFADLAEQLSPLFDAMAAEQPLSGFAQRVYNAMQFERQGRAFSLGEGLPPAAKPELVESDMTEATDGEVKPVDERAAGESDLQELLTYREMDVLKLLEERLSNKEIAHILGISSETVRQHTVNLFRKLNVDNRRQAVVMARRMGQSGSRT